MRFFYDFHRSYIVTLGVFAFAMFGASLMVPLSSFGQSSTAQDSSLIKALVRSGLEGFVLGFLYICASLFAVSVYLRRRQEQHIVLSFAAFVFFAGMGPFHSYTVYGF